MRTQECRKHIRKTGVVCHLKEETMSYVENIMDFCEKHPEISTLSTDAAKTLMKIPDTETRERALSSVGNALNRKTPTGGIIKKRLTKPEVEKAIKKVLPPENEEKKSCDVKPSDSPKTDKPVSPFQPEPGSIPVTDTAPIKSLGEIEKLQDMEAEMDRLKEEEKLHDMEDEIDRLKREEHRKAPCLSHKPCPDGGDHKTGNKCALWGQPLTGIPGDECWLVVKARRDTERANGKDTGFVRASGLNIPVKSTQGLPTIGKHPLLKSRKEQDAATDRFINDCLTDRYHRVIRDAITAGQPTALDAICKGLDLLSEWEGE